MDLPCFYCNRTGVNLHRDKNREHTGVYAYNGLDRIDNNIGYIKSNVVPCCGPCNLMRRSHSSENFIKLCTLISGNFITEKEITERMKDLDILVDAKLNHLPLNSKPGKFGS